MPLSDMEGDGHIRAAVTLPGDAVLQLTHQDSERFPSSSSRSNDRCNFYRYSVEGDHHIDHLTTSETTATTALTAATSIGTSPESVAASTVTLPTEQILNLTTARDESNKSAASLDLGESFETSTSSTNPARSSTPLKKRKKPKRTSSRELPNRTRSREFREQEKLKKAVKKEKQAVDGMVQAAIRKYEGGEGSESSLSDSMRARRKKKSSKPQGSPRSVGSAKSPRGRSSRSAKGSSSHARKSRPQREESPQSEASGRSARSALSTSRRHRSRSRSHRTSRTIGTSARKPREESPLSEASGRSARSALSTSRRRRSRSRSHRNRSGSPRSVGSGCNRSRSRSTRNRSRSRSSRQHRSRSRSHRNRSGSPRSSGESSVRSTRSSVRTRSNSPILFSTDDKTSSGTKKKRKGRRRPAAAAQQQPQKEPEVPYIGTPTSDAPSPPPLEHHAESLERAGAIAVFPSNSHHQTQRRSITQPQRISDIDDIVEVPNTNTNHSRSGQNPPGHSIDTLFSNRTIEEIAPPPESQVIDAETTFVVDHNNQNASQWPPMTASLAGGRPRVTSAAMSRASTIDESVAMSMPPLQSVESGTTRSDEFLGSTVDPESGTVTARAILEDDYYNEVRNEVRRELQQETIQEAVPALDVLPVVTADGRNLLDTSFIDESGKVREEDDRKWWIRYKLPLMGAGILFLFVLLIAIMTSVIRRTGPGNSVPIRNTTNTDSNIFDNQNIGNNNGDMDMDMDEIEAMMVSEYAEFWRREIADLLPREALLNILVDPNMMSPQYKAFIFLIECGDDLFHGNMNEPLSALEQSRASTLFALVTLYYSLNGPNWYVKTNWLRQDVDFCEWHGVNCKGERLDKANYPVKQLGSDGKPPPPPSHIAGNSPMRPPHPDNVQYMGPVGTGGGSLYYEDDDDMFSYETYIDTRTLNPEYFYEIESNDGEEDYFVDKIPIHSLDLKATGLTGELPEEIGLLSNIYGAIDLSFNAIFGSVPTSMGNLSKLQGVILKSNELTSTLPTELGMMTDLREFNIAGTSIEGSLPVESQQWRKIEELQVQSTRLAGQVPEEFCEMVDARSSFRFKYLEEFNFKADCPDPLECSCCTQCCSKGDKIAVGNGVEECVPLSV